MGTADRVLEMIRRKPGISGAEIARQLGITRQAVNRHVSRLLEERSVAKTGTTRAAGYAVTTAAESLIPPRRFTREYRIAGLEEDRSFEEVSLFLSLDAQLSPSALTIFRYAFTEMLNNAIDHSAAETCSVASAVDDYWAAFTVTDGGIGIFASIAGKFELADEVDAVLELSKGKRTTQPDRHAGEGVFFTSRCADRLEIRSHAVSLLYRNGAEDIHVEKIAPRAGTSVDFRIRKRAKRSLQSVFDAYAPEDFDFRFERTRVNVRLLGTKYVSRSEARRLLAGLDRFRDIVLDFKGTAGIGQGFADEVFRVFASIHPEIRIEVENANEVVARMIAHARA